MDTLPLILNRERQQQVARVLLGVALLALGIWTLQGFLRALIWAGILAIAVWPLYARAQRRLGTGRHNILLPLLGAIVTDSGGLLSHSAIVAREYGIPGVVGTREGTERIADGVRVRVDGDAGEVTVLA